MRRHHFVLLPALAAVAACGPAVQTASTGAPADRILVTDAQGQVIRQSSLNDHASMSFNAPLAKVWSAVIATYADLGIEANYADQASGRYGVRNYTVPRALHGERIGALFSCGSSLTGALVDDGTVTGEIVTTVAPTANGMTTGVIFVFGSVRRNDGNATNPVACASTGRLEEMIRASVERKLSGM